jgi:NADH:ubiquinone oxidoreductase subunit 5 (subunit L)/multisubunit Na+/H+ antiporter MnhA subunit
MKDLLWLLISLPLGSGALLAGSGWGGRARAAGTGVGVAAVTLGVAIAVAIGRPSVSAPFLAGLPVGLAVDGLSEVFVVTTAAVSLAVLIYSAGELARDAARQRFFGLMLLFSGGMLLTVTATDLLTLLLAWELMGAC